MREIQIESCDNDKRTQRDATTGNDYKTRQSTWRKQLASPLQTVVAERRKYWGIRKHGRIRGKGAVGGFRG